MGIKTTQQHPLFFCDGLQHNPANADPHPRNRTRTPCK
ncbi:hypothetical protein M5D96_007607 [Drosophila gunungcola]|uniref:Uncharacterized protein n=1 Tax=Drosophila gunungcola TaxID=103775 RepID=A0A9Q0BPU9_9MUSC|nr:hypothetical protein M5D96_007607 [Drosophila gunungcola]